MVDSLDFKEEYYHIPFVPNCYRFYMIVSGEMENLGKRITGFYVKFSVIHFSYSNSQFSFSPLHWLNSEGKIVKDN